MASELRSQQRTSDKGALAGTPGLGCTCGSERPFVVPVPSSSFCLPDRDGINTVAVTFPGGVRKGATWSLLNQDGRGNPEHNPVLPKDSATVIDVP